VTVFVVFNNGADGANGEIAWTTGELPGVSVKLLLELSMNLLLWAVSN
jgi:hypothetical protein